MRAIVSSDTYHLHLLDRGLFFSPSGGYCFDEHPVNQVLDPTQRLQNCGQNRKVLKTEYHRIDYFF